MTHGARATGIVAGGHHFRGLQDVEQMMRHAGPFGPPFTPREGASSGAHPAGRPEACVDHPRRQLREVVEQKDGARASRLVPAQSVSPGDVVVDGGEEWTQVRPICFQKAEARVKPGGIIVVDDSWRYPSLRERNHARQFRVFKSVGPCRPGVTSTDVFFY